MVDFNTETAITAPANLVKLQILEARYNVIYALEFVEEKKKYRSIKPEETVRGRIKTLYLTVYSLLKTRFPKRHEEIKKFVNSDKVEDNELAFLMIDEILYKVGLTRVEREIYKSAFHKDIAHGL